MIFIQQLSLLLYKIYKVNLFFIKLKASKFIQNYLIEKVHLLDTNSLLGL